MDQNNISFPLTSDQFDALIHYIGIRITASFESPDAKRLPIAQQHLEDMKSDLRRVLVGPDNA